MERTLRISELPGWMTEHILRELCQTLGTVTNVRLVRDPYRQSMRYGLIGMATRREAETVVAALNRHRTFGPACLLGSKATFRNQRSGASSWPS